MADTSPQTNPEEMIQQPTFVLTPLDSAPLDVGKSNISLGDVLLVLWSRRLFIVLGTLICGAVGLAASMLSPSIYRANATLIVSPPRFSTELKPSALPVETYQSLVETDAVRAKVADALNGDGKNRVDVRLDASLSTSIQAGRQRNQSYLPSIGLVVEAKSPQRAALIANTWAAVVVAEIGDLSMRAKSGDLEFINREYPIAKQRLAEAEKELKDAEDQYGRRIREMEDRFDKEIASFKVRWNLEGMRGELRTLLLLLNQPGEKGLLSQLQAVRLATKRAKDELAQLRKEIQSHPQFLLLAKAITDDALWDKIGSDSSGAVSEDLEALRLRTQELNPVYSRLGQRLADAQVDYEALIPQEGYLQEQIADLRTQIEDLNRMIENQETAFRTLERHRFTELASLRRERDFRTGELKRDVVNLKRTFNTLSEKYESARLAKAEESSDIQLGMSAIANGKPVRPRTVLNTAIALAIGLVLCIGLAFIIEFARSFSRRQFDSPNAI